VIRSIRLCPIRACGLVATMNRGTLTQHPRLKAQSTPMMLTTTTLRIDNVCAFGSRGFAKKAGGKGSKKQEVVANDDDDNDDEAQAGATVDLDKARAKISKLMDSLKAELAKLRARPDASMLDHIRVQAYGKPSPLSAVAQVSLKSPKLLQINVFDPQMIEPVRAVIEQGGLGLNPSVEGSSVMVPIPKTTKETREMNVKKAKELREKTRNNINSVRRDAMKEVTDLKKSKTASDDECFRLGKDVDAMTEKAQAEVVKVCEEREKEIMSS
jgi:ribosome recycling factor